MTRTAQRPRRDDGGAVENLDRFGTDTSRPGRQPGTDALRDDQPDTWAADPADGGLPGRDRAEHNVDDWWLDTAMQAVRAMAATGREFQCYDLVETYGVPDPNRWGVLLTRAARENVIVPVGAAQSRRPATALSLTRTRRGAR